MLLNVPSLRHALLHLSRRGSTTGGANCHPCLEGSTAASVYFNDQSNKVRKSKANISQKNFLGLDDQCES